MKKVIVLIGLGLFVIAGVVMMGFNALEASKTTVPITKSWELTSPNIEMIALDGTQQDVDLTINYTDEPSSYLVVNGKVSEESADMLEEAEVSEDNLYLPFSKKGFRVAVSSSGKDRLEVTLKLGKDVTFKDLSLDTWTGNVTVTVPKGFSGKFDLDSQGGKVYKEGHFVEEGHERITIATYGDIILKER